LRLSENSSTDIDEGRLVIQRARASNSECVEEKQSRTGAKRIDVLLREAVSRAEAEEKGLEVDDEERRL
jgi:hypothetical protein